MNDQGPNQQDAPVPAAILLDFDTWIELAPRLMDLPMRGKARVLDERGIDLGDWLPSHAGSGTLPLGADPMAEARATLPFGKTTPGDAVPLPAHAAGDLRIALR